jgi:hypothetical protein
MTREVFLKLNLIQKIEKLKSDGNYIGARERDIHRIHLYAFFGYFIELWILKSLNQIQWIEVQTNEDILALYVHDLNLEQDLFN